MRRKKSIKKFCFTHVKDESYNEITINPNKSFQPTETAGLQSADLISIMFRRLKLDVIP